MATIDGETFNLSQRATELFASTDPIQRLCGLIVNLTSVKLRLIRTNAPRSEIELLNYTLRSLMEVCDGNFSNSMWKAAKEAGSAKGLGTRPWSLDRSLAKGGLMALVVLRKRIDGCSLAKACSRVAVDVDRRLRKIHGTSLEKQLPKYSTASPGDPDEVNRGRKEAPVWGDENPHPLHNRIADWFDTPQGWECQLHVDRMDAVITDGAAIGDVYNHFVSQTVHEFVTASSTS